MPFPPEIIMRMAAVLILASFLTVAINAQLAVNDPPADFKSDNCTLFPDGNYADCCISHDLDYYRGGSEKERRRSDMRLYRCVRDKKGWQNEVAAPIMLLGVRIFGVSFLPTPFRWGFGKRKR